MKEVTNGDDSDFLAFTTLIESINTLSSQDNYKLVHGYLSEIKRLQEEVTDKEQAFAAHSTLTTDLAKQKLTLRKTLDERDEMISQLKRKRDDLKDQVQKLEEQSTKQKDVIEKAKVKVKQQGETLQSKSTQFKELEGKLDQANKLASQLEADLNKLKSTNKALMKKHDEVKSKLGEVNEFAVSLREEDSEAV